ncbi:MAG TPA: hypothetical protein VFO82_03835 [Steroidobacteraceae bacterium]|nr:hypothetical protein [Steroidobacteraceae bacterium]
MVALAVTPRAQAVEFDEKLKAPMMKSQATLHSQAQAYGARFVAVRDASPEQLIRNSALAREKFDVVWQIQRAIDERKPLGELAEAGIALQADGSYLIDTKGHPEWNDLHQTIAALLSDTNLDRWVPLLVARGFRPEDVQVLREYVGFHDPVAASAAATLPIALGFGRTVRKFDQLKRPVSEALVQTFWYQRARAASEANRVWVEGLMKVLDAQRGRILLSSFLELSPITYWSPENVDEGTAALLAEVRRPDFEAIVTAEAKGVAR